MVAINKTDNNITFEVLGMHKVWAFTRKITVTQDNIVSVRHNRELLNGWKGWRILGTSIPFLFQAGTFMRNGKKIFWDVIDKDKALVVTLQNAPFDELVIEVENISEAMAVLAA